jgi:hypothetical protein
MKTNGQIFMAARARTFSPQFRVATVDLILVGRP